MRRYLPAYVVTAGAIGVLVGFAQTASSFTTAAVDQSIAEYFEHCATRETIETRIQHAIRANHGASPDHIRITSPVKPAAFVSNVPPGTTPPDVPPDLLSAVLNSDVAILGVPTAARALPIADHSFVFTEYSVQVHRVFFSKSPDVSLGRSIVVSAAGGTLNVDSVRLDAVEEGFDPIQMNEAQVFCLRAVGTTGTYAATAFGTYHLGTGTAVPAARAESAKANVRRLHTNDFLAAVQAAANLRANTRQ